MSNCIHCGTPLPGEATFCPSCGLGQDQTGPMTLGGLETLDGHATNPGARKGIPALAPGARFADRYTILGLLGAGGMGVVYRAKDDMGEREVALKLIRPDRAGSEREVKRLVDEGLTARDIRHPNVVAVYDVGSFEGTPFLSMEVVEGTSLRTWMRDRMAKGEDIPVASALAIARSIALGLSGAHAKDVIHRDLKPENVILEHSSEDPVIHGDAGLKVLDFGIARVGRGTQAESGTGSGVGTPRYMAPEQVTNADLAGPSADVYSLSCLLYELLVGVLPQGHWQPPSAGRSGVTHGIDELVREGLSNRPTARPQTMDEFIERLDGAGGDSLLDVSKRAFTELEKTGERWRSSYKSRWNPAWNKAAIAIGVLILGAAIADEFGAFDGTPSGVGSGYQEHFDDQTHDDLDHFVDGETEGKFDRFPSDPRVLSGLWEHATGSNLGVTVSKLGRVRGEGTVLLEDGFSAQVVPATIRGKIDKGGAISYEILTGGQLLLIGEGMWTGQGMFSVQHSLPGGIPVESDSILVNGGEIRSNGGRDN